MGGSCGSSCIEVVVCLMSLCYRAQVASFPSSGWRIVVVVLGDGVGLSCCDADWHISMCRRVWSSPSSCPACFGLFFFIAGAREAQPIGFRRGSGRGLGASSKGSAVNPLGNVLPEERGRGSSILERRCVVRSCDATTLGVT